MGIHIILNQIMIMFFLMAFGYILIKKELLDKQGSRQISNILLKTVTPIVIINAFNIQFSLAKLKELALALVLGFVVLGIGFIIARIFLGKGNRFEQFPAAFPNVGFFGIPLVQGLLGSSAVFYLTMVVVAYNIYSWTYGIYLISGQRDTFNPKAILTTPAFKGLGIGLLVFLSPWPLPDALSESIRIVASLNTPLAMFILGSYIAESPFLSIFKGRMVYKTCAIKLIIIPAVIAFALKLVPSQYETLKMVLLIASSAPSGVVMAMFAQQYNADYAYGAQIISLSTLLSIISIPAILVMALNVW